MVEGGGRFPKGNVYPAFILSASPLTCWPNSLAGNEFCILRQAIVRVGRGPPVGSGFRLKPLRFRQRRRDGAKEFRPFRSFSPGWLA